MVGILKEGHLISLFNISKRIYQRHLKVRALSVAVSFNHILTHTNSSCFFFDTIFSLPHLIWCVL